VSDQPRVLPGQPSLRYLKVEAKRRLAAGEFATLHDAQLAIAREHGHSSWAKLKQQIDANDASLEAQNGLVQNQQTEIVRINALYDAELARLRKLWSGAPAGSLGPLPGPPVTTVAAPDLTKATATK